MSSNHTDRPPASAAGDNDTTTADRPRELTAEEFALMGGSVTTDTRTGAAVATPTMTPPGTAGTASAGAAGSISGQQVTALWSNESNRNSWMYMATAGWKKLSNLSDGGSSNLAQLAASARQTGSAPYVFDDATGLITTMYVW